MISSPLAQTVFVPRLRIRIDIPEVTHKSESEVSHMQNTNEHTQQFFAFFFSVSPKKSRLTMTPCCSCQMGFRRHDMGLWMMSHRAPIEVFQAKK